MMLTDKDKADKLREAIALLMDVDNLQQAALGDSDECYDYHNAIQNLIDDLADECQALESKVIAEL
jgi:hypothetical protein